MSTARDATTTDEELAEAVTRRGRGDGSATEADRAFRTLYDRHARALMAYLAARVARSDLDDINQEVWRRIWQHLPGGFRGGVFRSWLFEVARNALIDHGRKRRPDSIGDDDQKLTDHRQGPADAPLIEEERTMALRRCLDQLDPKDANLVRARLGGRDYEEICRKLGLTPAQAHKRFHAAKARLRSCIQRARV